MKATVTVKGVEMYTAQAQTIDGLLCIYNVLSNTHFSYDIKKAPSRSKVILYISTNTIIGTKYMMHTISAAGVVEETGTSDDTKIYFQIKYND